MSEKLDLEAIEGRCSEPGCNEPGYHCELPDGTPFAYCGAHMWSNGFCPGCGHFWAGVESFDFGPGYCENCASLYVDEDDDDLDAEPDWDSYEAEMRP